ncbi:Protein CBG07308 [Caenorhabditis briggsae]|uniref:Protein CBG07308 n=1 Tax=Caenorhabditis briggsae TaxID=6238 RepID=A8X515_CAEBR|nr:Protein CBG07308 [Caenorhabditis briggsae]CAP27725.2 Protein CBG07308 [Caenorhabditis briggsae]
MLVCVAEEKSFWVPDAKFTWLGYECDLVAKEVRGTEKRMATWWSALDELRRSLAPTVLDRMKFLGCLASFELVAGDIGVAKAKWMMQVVGENQKKKSESKLARKKKSPGEEKEIEFWRARGAELLRRNLLEVESKPDFFLYTDASARGIGALLKNERQDILWKMKEIGDGNFEKQSSAWKELTTIKVASARISSNLKGRVQVLVDSQAAVSVLRRGSMKPELHSLAERVWHNLENVDDSSFLWIPREKNVEADEASRNFDFDDWGIAERVFIQAQRMWGEIKVDWFADANNKKTELYFSRYPEFGTSGVNVFEHVERAERMGLPWLVPPPVLIPQLIKIMRRRRLRGVLVAPRPQKGLHDRETSRERIPDAPGQAQSSRNWKQRAVEDIGCISACKKTVVEVTIQDVEKITKLAMDEITPARDRDALLAIFSFHVMLRASEAAEIKWEGVTQKDGMIEVHVEKAKNDQLRLGRSSFFNYDPGNAAIGKSGATHHAFRRGGANHMRATGYSMEEIQARGRWRSLAGLQRYIKDVPRAQGRLYPKENGIGVEEDDEDFE